MKEERQVAAGDTVKVADTSGVDSVYSAAPAAPANRAAARAAAAAWRRGGIVRGIGGEVRVLCIVRGIGAESCACCVLSFPVAAPQSRPRGRVRAARL